MVFTDQDVAMLPSVLNGRKAIWSMGEGKPMVFVQFLWDGTFIKEMERKLLNLVDNVP